MAASSPHRSAAPHLQTPRSPGTGSVAPQWRRAHPARPILRLWEQAYVARLTSALRLRFETSAAARGPTPIGDQGWDREHASGFARLSSGAGSDP
jgi:hypothetical protein